MLKTFFKIFFSLILIALIAAVAIGFYLWQKSPSMLSDTLTKKLGVPVTIESIDLAPNTITITNLVISNLPKAILPKAFSAKKIQIHFSFLDILDKDLTIPDVNIENIYLGFEFDDPKSPKGNWTRLMSNTMTNLQATEQALEKEHRSVLIQKLKMQHIHSQVVYKTQPEKIYTLPMIPEMILTDISSEDGIPLDQITKSILGNLLLEVFKAHNINNMIMDIFNPKKTIKKIISPFKKLNPFQSSPKPANP